MSFYQIIDALRDDNIKVNARNFSFKAIYGLCVANLCLFNGTRW